MGKVERDNKGRFLPGSKASPGRAPRATEREYLNVLLGAVSLDKWQKMVAQAVKLAIAGDHQALKWIGEYVLGKPPQTLDIRAADAALLGQLLKQLEAQGLSASDVFAAMLAQIAVEQEEIEEDVDAEES